MASKVLWEIDNETSGSTFERLCVDLLHRSGYFDIIPIEPQDGGRDAEETPQVGRSGRGSTAYFQFSLEKDWKAKLRRDARRLQSKLGAFDTLVFVTSQTARGVDTDAFQSEFRNQYGLSLFIYGREWLRFQLEEKHPDLASRHLGVELSGRTPGTAPVVGLKEPLEEQLKAAKHAVDVEDFDLANARLKRFLISYPDSLEARLLLAWSYYRQDRFDEALAEINRAQRLGSDEQTWSVKACILAEKGIREHDHPSLLSSLDLLKVMLDDPRRLSWELFYNLGNVLEALHRHDEAIEHYRVGIALDANQPTLWKNLASALHEAGQHEEEMTCLDKALELDPQQPEALVSKAVSLLMDFEKAEEAIPLFQFAIRLAPESVSKWPHVLFWYSLAYEKLNNLKDALSLIEESLEQQPGDRPSRHRKSKLLARLLLEDQSFTDRAVAFWQSELVMEPRNFDIRRNLVRAYENTDLEIAWRFVDATFSALDIEDVVTLRGFQQSPSVALEPLTYLPQYRTLRIHFPLSRYWDPNDLLNCGHSFSENAEVAGRLTSYFALAFGNAWSDFSVHPEAKINKEALCLLFDNLRVDILRAVTEASRCIGPAIGDLRTDVDKMSASLASAIVFFNTVALREFGTQRGFLMSEFDITPSMREAAMNEYDENRLNEDVLEKVITAINDGARLFRTNDTDREESHRDSLD